MYIRLYVCVCVCVCTEREEVCNFVCLIKADEVFFCKEVKAFGNLLTACIYTLSTTKYYKIVFACPEIFAMCLEKLVSLV